MGCDIHYVVEERAEPGSDWLGVLANSRTSWPGLNQPLASRRDYDFFANVAGVRGTPDKERGGRYAQFLPPDPSPLALREITRYGNDGHSHSWLPLDEFISIWRACNPNASDKVSEAWPEEEVVGIYRSDDAEYRVVFWFDN